ncbi:MAG: hypothetical protein LBR44_11135, partial [Clostridiales Family XIII bacterium]|nr:hypothetical protein [Clostridiales Family XIII bacterium]
MQKIKNNNLRRLLALLCAAAMVAALLPAAVFAAEAEPAEAAEASEASEATEADTPSEAAEAPDVAGAPEATEAVEAADTAGDPEGPGAAEAAEAEEPTAAVTGAPLLEAPAGASSEACWNVGYTAPGSGVVATIVMAADAPAATKAMIKSSQWSADGATWSTEDMALTAGNTYYLFTPLSGMG